MKDCNWNYYPWGVREDYPEKDWSRVIPHPFCEGCAYMQACAFRVNYWVDHNSDMPEEDIEIIKDALGDSRIIKSSFRNKPKKFH